MSVLNNSYLLVLKVLPFFLGAGSFCFALQVPCFTLSLKATGGKLKKNHKSASNHVGREWQTTGSWVKYLILSGIQFQLSKQCVQRCLAKSNYMHLKAGMRALTLRSLKRFSWLEVVRWTLEVTCQILRFSSAWYLFSSLPDDDRTEHS